jgi:hypothetical protein
MLLPPEGPKHWSFVAQGPKRNPTLALDRENTWVLALERPLSAFAYQRK